MQANYISPKLLKRGPSWIRPWQPTRLPPRDLQFHTEDHQCGFICSSLISAFRPQFWGVFFKPCNFLHFSNKAGCEIHVIMNLIVFYMLYTNILNPISIILRLLWLFQRPSALQLDSIGRLFPILYFCGWVSIISFPPTELQLFSSSICEIRCKISVWSIGPWVSHFPESVFFVSQLDFRSSEQIWFWDNQNIPTVRYILVSREQELLYKLVLFLFNTLI
jgi:hypothetical protein